jgi:pimeloyl-ACP methyl ester carboxylesterase
MSARAVARLTARALVGLLVACGVEGASGDDPDATGEVTEITEVADTLDVAEELSPDEDAAGDDSAPPISAYDFPIDLIAAPLWAPCSLLEGEDDGHAECAEIQAPYRWTDPDARPIPVYAKRLLAPDRGAVTAQLWLITGGPGGSGVSTQGKRMERLQERYPAADLYTIDHRGTGRSERLSCPQQEAWNSSSGSHVDSSELPACRDYLAETYEGDLSGFGATPSAIDLAAFVHFTRAEDVRVFVWGGSYGTYLVQRYLQLFPEQVDGVILEGISSPMSSFVDYGQGFDRAGRETLTRCGQDPFCAERLTEDPLGLYVTLLDQMSSAGHCVEITQHIPIPYLKSVVGMVLMYPPYNTLVAPVTQRLVRCTPEDVNAFWMFLNYFYGEDGLFTGISSEPSWSSLLNMLVRYSELWFSETYPDEAAMKEHWAAFEADSLFGSSGRSGLYEHALVDEILYADEDYDDAWAETATPMLMLQGDLDPATELTGADQVGEHFTGEHQHYVVVRDRTHSVAFDSPYQDDEDAAHCGLQLWLDFMDDPLAPLDTSCVEQVFALDFDTDPELAQDVFGSPDAWGEDRRAPRPPAMDALRLHRLVESVIRHVDRGAPLP